MTVKLGTPKYEQGTKNYFAFKKDQNTFILRVLPPMGDLAESGKWSIYHRVEFGYRASDNRLKPFLSPRVVNFDKMVEVESEAHLRREMLKSQQAQAKAAGNSALVEQCTNMLLKYNQDAKHYMNVVDLNGQVGLFKIGHRGFQALKAEIEKLRSEGVDPIGITNGRFFVFSRSGKNRDTIYTVNEYKQKQEIENNGVKMAVDVPYPHTITESIKAKLATDAFELDKIYPTVTPEEEYRIVHEGATAVDEILGKKKLAAPTNTASTVTTTTSETVVPTTADLAQTLEPTPTPVLTETFEAPASNVAEMSEEDFFKKVESGNF